MECAVPAGTVEEGLLHLCLLMVSLVTYAQLVLIVQMGQISSRIVCLELTGKHTLAYVGTCCYLDHCALSFRLSMTSNSRCKGKPSNSSAQCLLKLWSLS